MSADDASDPFRDQEETGRLHPQAAESTLVVGRDASLTLGTDSLIVLDDAIPREPISGLQSCNPFSNRTSIAATRSIPFYNVLWASLNEHDLTIHHAHPVSDTVVRPKCIAYPIVKPSRTHAAQWIDRLLEKAYGQSQRSKRIKLLINPFGGSGSAQKWFKRDIEPLLAAARCEVDVERTQYSRHAIEIARDLDIDSYDVVAACSGDGVPHEVFNGLALRPDAGNALASVAVVQLPCGTGNALSLNLNGTDSPSRAALAVIKGLRTPLDLVSVSQGEKRTLSFLTQALGIVAETDLGTEHLRWMGDFRFTYGFLVRLLGKTTYPCDIALKIAEDTKPAIRQRCREYRQANVEPRAPDTASTTTAATESTTSTHSKTDSLLPADQQKAGHPLAGSQTDSPSAGLPALLDGSALSPLPTTASRTATWGPLLPHPTIGNFYAGNMPWVARDMNFFPAALPADGCLDLICIDGNISRMDAVRVLLGIGNSNFFDLPWVEYRKVEGYRIVPWPRGHDVGGNRAKGGWGPGHGWGIGWESGVNAVRGWMGMKPLQRSSSSGSGSGSAPGKKKKKKKQQQGFVAIDGESFPYEPFQVEVHRGLGTVLSRSGKMYESPVCE